MATSRESEALRTDVVHRLLGVFLPDGGSYRWADGDRVVNGVFLEAADTICIDACRRGWRDHEQIQLRRRITIRVTIEETELPPAP